jgi:hypothetical protein
MRPPWHSSFHCAISSSHVLVLLGLRYFWTDSHTNASFVHPLRLDGTGSAAFTALLPLLFLSDPHIVFMIMPFSRSSSIASFRAFLSSDSDQRPNHPCFHLVPGVCLCQTHVSRSGRRFYTLFGYCLHSLVDSNTILLVHFCVLSLSNSRTHRHNTFTSLD